MVCLLVLALFAVGEPSPPGEERAYRIEDCTVQVRVATKGCHVLVGKGEECNNIHGVKAEKAFLKETYPGYSLQKQFLAHSVDTPPRTTDYVTIVTANGEKKGVCFDITDLW